MTNRVAEVRLGSEHPRGLGILGAISDVLESSEARVVLIDATGQDSTSAPFEPAELRDLILFELPVVFVFEGNLTAAATDLALAADLRICSETASLRGPLRGNARIRTLADEATSLTLFLGRTSISASDLLKTGLVSTVTPPGGALAEARRTAEIIASRGPIATRLGKEAIWRGLPQPLDQALRFETDLTLLLQTTKDRAEGVRAFLEKRTPNFTGE
jgi:enoyl-CoA hydratase/carnithine racemase